MKTNNLFRSTLLAFLLISTIANAQNWNLVWADEFNTNGSIDEDKWFHQTQLPNGYSWYNNEVQHYTDEIENSNVSNGTLKIVAIKENYTDQGHTKPYTSARLNSKFAFTYGKVEVRAKLPEGQGTWPAIWTLGKNITEPGAYWFNQGFGTTSWPSCGEIDIMEHWGSNQNYVQSATHTPSSYGGTVNHGGQVLPTASTQFHTYELVWNEDELIFSVDGVEHYTYNPPVKDSGTWPFDAEQYLLLNLAIEPNISPSFQQGTLEIDYVRVYEPSSDPAGCMDVNATNYDSEATIQDYDEWGNILCVYESCDDVPEYGCIYAESFGAFNDGFGASDCESYDGTPCEEEIPGCTDESANNYNADANIDDGSCEYPEPASGIVFSGVFGGTFADANTYTNPSGSESWAGFANEDASLYPLFFGEGGSITFTGSTDGDSADVYFRFEKNPYPDTEPSFNTTSVTLGADSATYTIDISSQGGNTFSSFLLYVTTPDVAVTLNNVTVNTSEYSGPVDVVGCLDAVAQNYNPEATVQGEDQYGNILCVYASCTDIPDDQGCIYPESYAPYNNFFTAANCTEYGGEACISDIPGCTDQSACNYDSTASIEDGSCEYPSPGYNCNFEFIGCPSGYDNYALNAYDSGNDGWGNSLMYAYFDGELQLDDQIVGLFGVDYTYKLALQFSQGCMPDIFNGGAYENCASHTLQFCVDQSVECINFVVTEDDMTSFNSSDPSEVSWEFMNPDGDIVASGGAGSTASVGTCVEPEPIDGIVFSGVFGGTFADANTYTNPTGSESWAGFANEDVSVYPFTFGEGGSITFTGSTDGDSADVYFRFEFNPYPATEPSYNTEVVTLGAESAEYTVNVPSTEDSFSSFLLYVTTPDVAVTLSNVTVNTSGTSDPVDVVGCLDVVAQNYNPEATVQGEDQYGNIMCVYASCTDIPDDQGCIYPESYAPYNNFFTAANCTEYGGTPCEDGDPGDPEATTYCAELVSHFNIETETSSEVFLTISNIDENNVLVSAVSANNDPIDLFLLGAQTDPAEIISSPIEDGVASLTLSWPDGAPSVTSFEILWSKESFGGNWMLGLNELPAINIENTCSNIPEYIPGCTEDNALNFNSDANIDDGSCEYSTTDTLSGIIFSGAFGGTYTDANTYTMPTGSESWAGFANEDASIYPFTFGEGGSITFTGSTDGASADVYFRFEFNPHPDTEPSFNTASVTLGADSAAYTIDVPSQGGNTFSSFLLYVTTSDVAVTLSNVTVNTSGPVDVLGCMDTNASNYNADANVDDGSCEYCTAPADWDVIVTGSNHTIVIPAGVVPQMAEGTELIHANVGVFYTNNDGNLACAGSAEITLGETVQISAMGDDTTTPEVDGLISGSDLVWMIADCYGNIFAANATYNAGPEVFTINGITEVSTITEAPSGPSEQELSFATGWSMFSTYMIPADLDLANLLAPIVEQVIIAKDYLGAAYLPEWNFNGIGDLTLGQGYQIKTTEATGITVAGDYAMPEDHPINLTVGWNMVAYLRLEPAAADAAFADINATGNLIIAKDFLGAAYLPEWNFNGIGDLNPGQAYQIKVNNADVLQYLSNDDSYRMSAVEVTENNVSHFAKAQVTDNNMTVVIEDAAWDVLPTEGAEIAAFDKDGNLVGSAIYSSPVTVLTVWGDDATSTSKDGMLVSESVSFKVWNTNEVCDFTVAKWIEGSSSYQVDGISVASTIETNNVMAELNASERVLIKVINVLGQEVNLDDKPFKGTVLFNVYDDGSVERFVE